MYLWFQLREKKCLHVEPYFILSDLIDMHINI